MPELGVKLCGISLKNPVIAASGTFGFGREYDKLYDISMLGGISVKGLTLASRQGNAPARVAETCGGMLNAVGLQNPGIDAFIERDLPYLLQKDILVIVNIAGACVDDYAEMAQKLIGSGAHMLEVNISCPNVREGGMAFGTDPDMVYTVTRAVKAVAEQPVMVKLSPNVTDIAQIAVAAQEGGADAISLINTLTGMAVDVRRRRPILQNNFGGLSGAAIKPVALRMVYQASHAVQIPVVGMGGIRTGEDVAAFMLCGARAVMVGTHNLTDPLAIPHIVSQLHAFLEQTGVSDVNELVNQLQMNGGDEE